MADGPRRNPLVRHAESRHADSRFASRPRFLGAQGTRCPPPRRRITGAGMRRLRLLWVTPDLPRPGVSASAERWWALLARLAVRHDITLLAISDPAVLGLAGAPPAGRADVHLVPRMPYTPDDPFALLPQAVAGAYADPALRDAIAARLTTTAFDLAQYEWVEMANLIPPSRTPTVLSLHQIGFSAQGPRWGAEGGGLARGAVLLHRYLRNLDFELRAVARADHVITMSPEDAARLRRFIPARL